METKSLQNQKGFTLVEIAIVLVIIGLLLGGVLKGQELIENTKIKAVKTDSDAVMAAIYAYQDRNRDLPGDLDSSGTITVAESIGGSGSWVELRADGFFAGSGSSAPFNSFGGTIEMASGVSGIVICHSGLNTDQMGLIDNRYDDGVATTGIIYGAADIDAGIVPTTKAFTAGERLCIQY